jgi:lipid A 3-O-deacylase
MGNPIKKYTLLLLFPAFVFGQKIDNTAAIRDLKSDNYFRFHYDNDYFTATDIYYTQGYSFELASDFFRKNPVNFVFLKSRNSENFYGLSLEHIAYAPTTIKSDSILYGDRPFSAAIALKSFLVSTDTIHQSRIASSLGAGIIGPGAFGKEMQTGIHHWIGDEVPHGWQHQIKNDLYLNYEVSHEKQIARFRNLFYVNSNAKLRLGTVNTNVSGGFTIAFGKVNSPFTSLKKNNRFEIFAYFETMLTLVGYDATLQGGLFVRESPYTIADSNLNRLTLQQNYGIVLQFKRLYFEYSRAEITKEFRTGDYHKWGGFRIGFEL